MNWPQLLSFSAKNVDIEHIKAHLDSSLGDDFEPMGRATAESIHNKLKHRGYVKKSVKKTKSEKGVKQHEFTLEHANMPDYKVKHTVSYRGNDPIHHSFEIVEG